MKRIPLLFISSVLCCAAGAQTETEITVLGVLLPGADFSRAVFFLNDLSSDNYWHTWSASIPRTPVRLANSGVPVPMPTPMTSVGVGTAPSQLAAASADALTNSLRRDADVVVYFTGSFSNAVCGRALVSHWVVDGGRPAGNRFQPDGSGLDLSGKDTAFEAIVATTGTPCSMPIYNDTAIHELSHIFGGVHETPPETAGYGLLPDSHAGYFNYFGNVARGVGTVDTTRTFVKAWSAPYPYSIFNSSGPSAFNWKAMTTTARSVANYRVTTTPSYPAPPGSPPPPQPPGCILSPPVGLTTQVAHQCNVNFETTYDTWWFDTCPGATQYYHVEWWNGFDYVPLSGTTDTSVPHIFISYFAPLASSTTIRVRACKSGLCSGPSSAVTISNQC